MKLLSESGLDVLPKRVLFKDFADKWIENRSVRPKTLEREKYLIKNHLVPEFGGSMLYTVTAEEVQTFVSRLGKQVSPYTARRVHDVLGVMLGDAKSYGYTRENVAWDTKRPELPHDEMRVLSLDQTCRLLEALPRTMEANGLHDATWRTQVGRGCGTAMEWPRPRCWAAPCPASDRFQHNGGRAAEVEAEPPHHRPAASVPAGPPRSPQRGVWIFSGFRGGPVNHRAFDRRVWLPIVRALRLDLTIHDLRHTCASLLLAFGRNPLYVAAQLGHASADTTLKKYGHLIREGQRLDEADTLRKVEEAYRRAKPVQITEGNGGSGKLRKSLIDAGRGGRI